MEKKKINKLSQCLNFVQSWPFVLCNVSQVCLCCNQCAASVWFWSVFGWGSGRCLLFIYEGQQEECDVMWAPVACVWGHCRPVTALHQTLAELKVDPPLQLHCRIKARCFIVMKWQCCPSFWETTWRFLQTKSSTAEKLTWFNSRRSRPGHTGETVGWLAFWVLFLLFLSICSALKA